MRLALSTITNDESGEHGCDWAILTLDRNTIEQILKRVSVANSLSDEDMLAFFSINFFDNSVSFHASSDEIEELLEPQDWLPQGCYRLNNHTSIPTPTETPTLVLFKNSLKWETDSKSGFFIETQTINYEDFEKILTQMKSEITCTN